MSLALTEGKAMQNKIGRALVVGAGISGIRSALDLAENGYGVTLIDRAPHLGGMLSRLDDQFPTNHCGMCKLLPLLERDNGSQFCLRKGLFHDNITIRTATQLTALKGEPGRMTARLRSAPTWVDPGRCVGCGQCTAVCPVEVPDAFNAGLTRRKAIYLPVPHSIPNPYVIDPAACTQCGACVEICPTHAVDLSIDQRGQFRILVVDDELVVRDSLKEWLVDEGFSVEMAASGEAALEMIADGHFHLMLSDIKMPGMDGVELLKQAKENAPDLTVVMMTAFATVESAVDAMKIGALDYLMKPFDPEKMMAMVMGIYGEMVAGQDDELEVGAVVLACGTDYVDPSQGRNTYGYGLIPHVITHLEFERLLSGTGPFSGRLARPGDGGPVGKIAFLQCIGSRDLQANADFCSTVCCMIAVKQARLAKEKFGRHIDAAIFYMDMRTPGLPYQRFRDEAATNHGVRFEQARVHSVIPHPDSGIPVLRYVSLNGNVGEEEFDLVVLAAGQRPAAGSAELAEIAGLTLNPWGFIQHQPFSLSSTANPGVMVAGSCGGLKDINASVIQASAAALNAGAALHRTGGNLGVESEPDRGLRDVSAEPPDALVVLCTCHGGLSRTASADAIKARLEGDPCVGTVLVLDRLCTSDGWQAVEAEVQGLRPNRILVGACQPYAFTSKLKAMAARAGLPSRLATAVDLRLHGRTADRAPGGSTPWSVLSTALVGLKNSDPRPPETIPVTRRALVVGGGIAGMTAALSIAEQGYPVDLVEQQDHLGGNLTWLGGTIEGLDLQTLLADTLSKVAGHPQIEVHLNSAVIGAYGQVGRFFTTVETKDAPPRNIEHGIVVLATGGGEAPTRSFSHGAHPGIITQKKLEADLGSGALDPDKLRSVAMLMCVDSRREPRNYCSRICCPTAIKQALAIKQMRPETAVTILYRDIMTCGFCETYFTQARRAGIIFIAYSPEDPPIVSEDGDQLVVATNEPVLDRPVEIHVDRVVLATGIVPALPETLAHAYGAKTTADGFFEPADFKWRPVDALTEGVFGCGIALGPRNVSESMATAQAAAQRALRILGRSHIRVDKVVARVRHSLCSLCERCIDTCPYGARTLNPEADQVKVNPVMCQGCGACAAACPNGAAVVSGFSGRQMLETIDRVVAG
jgi:heterodisulfide reductase subunit A